MYGQLRKQKGKNILRDLAVVEMFFATGARVYEISNIRIENIDMKTGSIYFNGKGRKERVIQIGEQSVIKLLQKYYEQNKAQIEKSGYFFVNQKGDRFSEQSIRRMLKKYTKQAGISRNITPHMFRHSFATNYKKVTCLGCSFSLCPSVVIKYFNDLFARSSHRYKI